MPQYKNRAGDLYKEIKCRFHNYKGLVMHSVYNADISFSCFFRCSSIILLIKPDMDVSGATTDKNRLI